MVDDTGIARGLMQYIKGRISDRRYHRRPLRHPAAAATGRGKIHVRARASSVKAGGSKSSSPRLPYQVNKARLIEISPISSRKSALTASRISTTIRTRNGMHIVIDVKSATPRRRSS